MKKVVRFEDLFQEGLESLYDAEKQIVAALPKMIAASSSEELAAAFESHLDATKQQVARLETIFEKMSEQPTGRECEGMQGLLRDGEKLLTEMEKSPTLDVALTAAGRKVEHWEIAAYGSVCALAEMLGQQDALELLQESLEEESEADEALTETADAILNGDATIDEEEIEGEDADEEAEKEV
jgi:ferritin-like metal-binding protein YciE